MAQAKGRINPKTGKPWTASQDSAADRKAGIKEGSTRDNALDRKRGVPVVVVAIKAKPKGKR
jgi:hypothetical protein